MNEELLNKYARDNKIRSIVFGGLRSCALLCATGIFMQTFLIEMGFDSSLIYINSTLVQAANVLTILLCSRWADVGNVFKRTGFTQLAMGILTVLYLPFCIWKPTGETALLIAFVSMTAISVLQSVCTGLYTVCEYKMPYYTFRAEDFGVFTAIGGILSSGISFLSGILMSALSERFDYVTIMFFALALSTSFFLIAMVIVRHQKSLISDSADEPIAPAQKVPYSKVLNHPAFKKVWPIHLLRGFSTGLFVIFAVVAVDLGFDTTVTTMMVSVSSVAGVIGCTVFGFMSRTLSPRLALLLGNLTFVALPLMLIPNKWVFLAAYAVVMFGKSLIDYGAAALMIFLVPIEIAGPYNAWRMVLCNAGSLLITTIASFSFVSPLVLIIITLLTGLISGVGYFSTKVIRESSPLRTRDRIHR